MQSESVVKKRNKKTLVIALSTTIASSLLLIFIAAFVIIQAFFPFAALKVFGFKLYLISYTGSMEPVLSYNDLIVVEKYDYDKLQTGDIIAFEAEIDGKMITITHEIIGDAIDEETGERVLRTKGVKLSAPDVTPVSQSGFAGTNRYIGRYKSKSIFFGYLFAFFKSGGGIASIAVNAACFIGIGILFSKYIKKDEEVAKENKGDDSKN